MPIVATPIMKLGPWIMAIETVTMPVRRAVNSMRIDNSILAIAHVPFDMGQRRKVLQKELKNHCTKRKKEKGEIMIKHLCSSPTYVKNGNLPLVKRTWLFEEPGGPSVGRATTEWFLCRTQRQTDDGFRWILGYGSSWLLGLVPLMSKSAQEGQLGSQFPVTWELVKIRVVAAKMAFGMLQNVIA
jgi:hypothetical protein